MENLIIIGAGGHGKVVADIALSMKTYRQIYFLDDDCSKQLLKGTKLIGSIDKAVDFRKTSDFIVALGENTQRKKIQMELEAKDYSMATLVHPRAVIGTDVYIDQGTVVMAGVVINSLSKIEKGCIINTGCYLDHNNKISAFTHISPGSNLAGTVNVGTECWLGIGCSISNNVSICSKTVVGAGAVVLKDISETGTYVGIPARKIK